MTPTTTTQNWLKQAIDTINDPGISVDSYDLCPECIATYQSLESIKDELPDSNDPEQIIMIMYDNDLHCTGSYCEKGYQEDRHTYHIHFSRVDTSLTERSWSSRIIMTPIEFFLFESMISRLCKWSSQFHEWVYDRGSFTVSIRIFKGEQI